jgi:voltage-gated potassium channel
VDYYEPSATEWERDLVDLRRRLLGALGFIVLVTIVGITGFSLIDPDAGLVRAFFMTAITLTTVGYGEEIAVDTDGARIFTAVLILVGMGAVLYFVSTGTAFLLEGQLGHVFRRKKMQRDLAGLNGHMIVCGSGPTALYAAGELATVQRDVVLVISSRSEAEHARSELPGVPVVLGDPTDDDIILAAGIERAAGVIACSESDNENVVITLTARQLNPTVRIVARLQDVEQESKIRKVGANGVVSPQHIGGLRLASELIRPAVVTFLDKMLRDRDLNLRIDEVLVDESSPSAGKEIRAMGLEDLPGVLLLAVRSADGAWAYNPSRSAEVASGNVLVFLGSPDDSRALRERLGGASVESSPTVES